MSQFTATRVNEENIHGEVTYNLPQEDCSHTGIHVHETCQ